jgi:DNA-3-methyladenine glycosylase
VRRLPRAFYARDALSVAGDLIGCLFVHDARPTRTAVRLVEVEAYRGNRDPGSHGWRGPTARNATMFGPPGRLYVYFTYGMHWCSNVVCGSVGVSEAVLLRAGEPLEGVETMRRRRAGVRDVRLLTSGPARLTQALGIGRRHDGASLLRGGSLWCAEDDVTGHYRHGDVARTPRIGLSAGRGDELDWRFVVRASPFASRR